MVQAATSSSANNWPSFFIVGAPRCATTSMYRWLANHPQVFMSFRKEPCYFCADFDSGSAEDAIIFVRDEQIYLANFAGARPGQRIGEACPWYLRSAVAPAAIHDRLPDAKIIVQLRHPVEMMVSMHALRVRNGAEPMTDFAAALAAEPERAAGRLLPARPRNRRLFQYRALARFGEQLAAYREVFPAEQVKVVILEELLADPAPALADVLRFLEVDDGYTKPFARHNPTAELRSRALGAVLRSQRTVRVGRRLLRGRPLLAMRALTIALQRRNLRPVPRAQLDPALRQQLMAELAPDLQRLGALIGRDVGRLWPA